MKIKGLKAFVALTLCAFVQLACVPTQDSVPLSPGWTVRCNVDAVSQSRRCFAGTFGRPMNADGQPFLPPSAPLQVYFVNGRGPFILAGWHTFPGRYPEIRFDDDKRALTVPDNGYGGNSPAPGIVKRMLSAKVARLRYHSWPDGAQDIYVDLTGFPEALAELSRIR